MTGDPGLMEYEGRDVHAIMDLHIVGTQAIDYELIALSPNNLLCAGGAIRGTTSPSGARLGRLNKS